MKNYLREHPGRWPQPDHSNLLLNPDQYWSGFNLFVIFTVFKKNALAEKEAISVPTIQNVEKDNRDKQTLFQSS